MVALQGHAVNLNYLTITNDSLVLLNVSLPSWINKGLKKNLPIYRTQELRTQRHNQSTLPFVLPLFICYPSV